MPSIYMDGREMRWENEAELRAFLVVWLQLNPTLTCPPSRSVKADGCSIAVATGRWVAVLSKRARLVVATLLALEGDGSSLEIVDKSLEVVPAEKTLTVFGVGKLCQFANLAWKKTNPGMTPRKPIASTGSPGYVRFVINPGVLAELKKWTSSRRVGELLALAKLRRQVAAVGGAERSAKGGS